jgi:hypothetical protein
VSDVGLSILVELTVASNPNNGGKLVFTIFSGSIMKNNILLFFLEFYRPDDFIILNGIDEQRHSLYVNFELSKMLFGSWIATGSRHEPKHM